MLVAEGNGTGQWQRVDGNFNPVSYPFGGAFFNSHPIYANIVDQTIDGQAMVKVPKFWFKASSVPSGQYAGKRYWMISDQPDPGFTVHPAFMNYGEELPQYWLGKYQGTADANNGKLGSQSGHIPLTGLDFGTMQARITSRNVSGVSGFMMWSVYQLSAVQLLALIEMGGADSQAIIGQGYATNGAGTPLSVSDAVVATASWRGMVGLWGNVAQMVDGLRVDGSSQYVVWDINGNRTLQSTAYAAPESANGLGYPVVMASARGDTYDLSAVFIPETVSSTPLGGSYGDVFHQVANGVAFHGGHYANGSGTGLFSLFIYNTAAASLNSSGSRLAKV